jgi:hypothetical protein
MTLATLNFPRSSQPYKLFKFDVINLQAVHRALISISQKVLTGGDVTDDVESLASIFDETSTDELRTIVETGMCSFPSLDGFEYLSSDECVGMRHGKKEVVWLVE